MGIWSAIQLKLLQPTLAVLVLEKYSTYQRSHVLSVEKDSFANAILSPALQPLFDLLDFNPKFSHPKSLVRTNSLEDALVSVAAGLGIKISNCTAAPLRELWTQYPQALAIIGSDGARSGVRTAMASVVGVPAPLSFERSLQHFLEVKYKVYGTGVALDMKQHVIPLLMRMPHVGIEYVGKPKADDSVGDAKTTTSSVSFRVVINRFDFARIRDSGKGTFKNPLDINADGDRALLGPDLAESVLVWLRAKVDLVGERVVPGSLLIAPIDLCVYCSSVLSVPSTYEAKEDVALAPIWNLLVGDAAFGVPFFRALNNGLICGAQLAKTIDQLVIRRTAAKNNGLLFHPEEPSICAAYSTFVANLAEEQTRRS